MIAWCCCCCGSAASACITIMQRPRSLVEKLLRAQGTCTLSAYVRREPGRSPWCERAVLPRGARVSNRSGSTARASAARVSCASRSSSSAATARCLVPSTHVGSCVRSGSAGWVLMTAVTAAVAMAAVASVAASGVCSQGALGTVGPSRHPAATARGASPGSGQPASAAFHGELTSSAAAASSSSSPQTAAVAAAPPQTVPTQSPASSDIAPAWPL